MTTTQLGFEKLYKTASGEKKKVIFEAILFEATKVSLQVMVDNELHILQNVGNQNSSSLDKVVFDLPIKACNEYGDETLFSSKVYYRELKQWKKAIDAIQEFGINPICNDVVRLVTYAQNAHEDLEFEVSRNWLMSSLQRNDLVEDAEDDLEVFLHTYTHDDSLIVYLDAKENQKVLKEEIYC